jgi:hypothetical protein
MTMRKPCYLFDFQWTYIESLQHLVNARPEVYDHFGSPKEGKHEECEAALRSEIICHAGSHKAESAQKENTLTLLLASGHGLVSSKP